MPNKAILITLGPNDILLETAESTLAAAAGRSTDTFLRVDNLAGLALESDCGTLNTLFADDCAYVAGCSRPRAAQALLSHAGIDWQKPNITWVPLPYDSDALKREYGVPWYPVIDRSRCTGCGTCHDYCLFSVYAKAGKDPAQRVRVARPLNCKTGCPACARLCPESALIFPFCQDAELNGSVADPARRTRESMIEALGDDPMRILAERRRKRQLIDSSKFEQAEKDRITYSGLS